MADIRTLVLLELRSFYGINKFLHTKDLKEKKRYRGLSVAWIIIIAMVFTYVGGLVTGLCSVGLEGIVPAYLAVISSFFVLFFGMFSAGNRTFGTKGYDILASMPLKTGTIAISRFISLYIGDLIFTSAIMLPGIATYCYFIKPDFVFYPIALIGVLSVPIIPLVISILFGTAILAISSRMKKKSLVQTVLSVLFVVGVLVTSFSLDKLTANITVEQFTNFANMLNGVFASIYPPAVWLNFALCEFNVLYLALFVGVSLAVGAVAVFIIYKNYHSIIRSLQGFSAKNNYKIGKLHSRGQLKALYIREAKRYFASSIYVTNTIIGPIMGAIMAVALSVTGIEAVKNSLPFSLDVMGLLPFAFGAVFCMMTTTSVAISMEGKQFWVVQSLPIRSKTLFDSKILLNLSLMLPFFAVSEIAFIIGLKPSAAELLWLITVPVCMVLFTTVFGITVNLKFHRFDWEQEATVVKQSMAAGLGGFAGFFAGVISIALVLLVSAAYADFAKSGICAVLLIGTVFLYRSNNKKDLADL